MAADLLAGRLCPEGDPPADAVETVEGYRIVCVVSDQAWSYKRDLLLEAWRSSTASASWKNVPAPGPPRSCST